VNEVEVRQSFSLTLRAGGNLSKPNGWSKKSHDPVSHARPLFLSEEKSSARISAGGDLWDLPGRRFHHSGTLI